MIKNSGVATALLCASVWTAGPLHAATASVDAQGTIIAALADTRSFRMSSAQFDKLVAPYCKKTSGDITPYDVLAEYTCGKETGISEIKINERKDPKHGGSYMMSLVMFMTWESYAPVKIRMEKQLGRPAKSGADYAHWTYRSDQKLNVAGIPSFDLSHDAANRITTFQLGLEQGP